MVNSFETSTRNSSFHLPMLLLTPRKRADLKVLYTYCRLLDDAVDHAPTSETALERLAFWEKQTDLVYNSWIFPPHPAAKALKKIHERIVFDPAPMQAILKALRMDANGEMFYPSESKLEEYCYGVASCVGLMAIQIFGCTHPQAKPFAISLGHALQLTNIWRDIHIDARIGRIYLAKEWMEAAGLPLFPAAELALREEKLIPVYKILCERAEKYYHEAWEHAAHIPSNLIAPALAMRDVYYCYWRQLKKRGYLPPKDGRIVLGRFKKIALGMKALRYILSA